MGLITIIINSFILFILSNLYIIQEVYNIKIPFIINFLLVILTIIFIVFISIFPSLLTKKLYNEYLVRIRNGYRLLIMFLINIILDIVFYLVCIIKYQVDIKVLLISILLLVVVLNIIFWSGMIRVYIFSRQLGIRYKLLGFILGLVPIAHLVMLIIMIHICRKEVNFENEKIKVNMARKDLEICKTKYPLLLVHGIFFRDFEKLNYWGRIPGELIKNGATIFYGNHSSSLSIPESAEEISKRIKQIIVETGSEKVNVIAHSKGGLDTRYAISNLGMDKYVASLTMINTPNHGCEFADYLLNKAPDELKNKVAGSYNYALKKLGDDKTDFIAGVSDLTFTKVEELNKIMESSKDVYYKSYGSVLKKARGGRFPLNLTTRFVEIFDGKNDGLVGINSFALDDNYELLEPLHNRGISHGDVIDLNRENIDGFDVREFYVNLVSELRNKGF